MEGRLSIKGPFRGGHSTLSLDAEYGLRLKLVGETGIEPVTPDLEGQAQPYRMICY
jgi:hypothetical protein